MAHENIYFESLKQVLDRTILRYVNKRNIPQAAVDRMIIQHITNTDNQHDNSEPDIDYDEPLCRLGYLYVHACVNATLFELTINRSSTLSSFINQRANDSLAICTVGGGPGTELLGLTKYLLLKNCTLAELKFTVLDSVQEWAETWVHLASVSESLLVKELSISPRIQRSFHQMNVVTAQSYQNYAWLFEETNLFVYNYLLSENKVRLSDFRGAFDVMISEAPAGSMFVLIDRLERATGFREQVTELVINSGLEICDNLEHGGVVTDEESAFGEYIQRFSPRRPRRWFRTRQSRYPTVFAIVARKP